MNDEMWRSYHFFYGGNLNDLLVGAVWPLIESAEAGGFIDNYFFIRYNEGGPHIRLRLHLSDLCHDGDVGRLLAQAAVDLEAHCEGAVVKEIPYVPETDRYGGISGLPVCERYFCGSSVICHHLITNDPQLKYDSVLGYALLLHICALASWTLPRPVLSDMLRKEYEGLLGYISTTEAGLEGVEDAFRLQLTGSGAGLYSWLTSLAHNIEKGCELDDADLQQWVKINTAFSKEIVAVCKDVQNIAQIFCSLIHMTNNRLGVKNVDEAYLMFILMEVLEAQVYDHE